MSVTIKELLNRKKGSPEWATSERISARHTRASKLINQETTLMYGIGTIIP